MASDSLAAQVEELTAKEEYGDLHKIVLQGIMGAGFLDAKAVKGLFSSACEYLKVPEDERAIRTSMMYVQKAVRRINDQIKPFSMAVRSSTCELSAKKFFIFVPTVEISLVKTQTVFSKVEIEMLQLCLDRMMRKYANFAVPLAECINTVRELDSRGSLQRAADFIQRLINLHYFTKYMVSVTEYDVTCGVRGLKEFEPLLLDKYRDVVQTCSLCKLMLLHGYRCPKCKMLVHKACYLRYVKSVKNCQDCKAPWSKEKDMIRRTRTTDEIIESEGVEVDLSGYRVFKAQPPAVL